MLSIYLCAKCYSKVFAYIISSKCHKNLLESVKDYSEVGTPRKGFQLEIVFWMVIVGFCYLLFLPWLYGFL